MADERSEAATKRTDDGFRGRPEDLAAWQAVNQAIGFLQAKREEIDAASITRPLGHLIDGLFAAADALNRPSAPITLATTAARMQQLRALCGAGHIRREELECLAGFYLEEADGAR